MWSYVIGFEEDLSRFMMVRSRKRGGWEMPGGRSLAGENPKETAEREFREETGHELITRKKWKEPMGNGFVFYGFIGKGHIDERRKDEIMEVKLFEVLPLDLAYPEEEYIPLIKKGRSVLPERS